MAKQVIPYNLAPDVTDDQYKDYVTSGKGRSTERPNGLAMTNEDLHLRIGDLRDTLSSPVHQVHCRDHQCT